MYCPKCGQQPPSTNVRFCNRCGLGLYELSLWLANAESVGMPYSAATLELPKKKRWANRPGAKLIFLSVVILPMAFMLSILFDGPGFLLVPLTIFLAGLSWTLYHRLFADEIVTREAREKILVAAGKNGLLTPGVIAGVDLNWTSGKIQTAEIAQPPSVTDRTTILLEKEIGS